MFVYGCVGGECIYITQFFWRSEQLNCILSMPSGTTSLRPLMKQFNGARMLSIVYGEPTEVLYVVGETHTHTEVSGQTMYEFPRLDIIRMDDGPNPPYGA